MLTIDPAILVQRIKQRNLPTQYIQEYYLPYRLSPDRMNYVKQKIKTGASIFLNHDFHPISYFYSVYLWLANFNKKMIGSVDTVFQRQKLFYYLVGLFLIASGIYFFIFCKNRDKRAIRSIYFSIMLIGGTMIGLEIIIIHGFQAIYGYAYFQLTLIMTGFMLGLAAGSRISLLQLKKSTNDWRRFTIMQWLLTLYPIITYCFLHCLLDLTLPAAVVQLVFLSLIFGLGFIGGYQFPLANSIVCQFQHRIDKLAGTIYAWDLFGSVIGALLISIIVVPIFGLLTAALAFLVMNLFISIVLIFFNK